MDSVVELFEAFDIRGRTVLDIGEFWGGRLGPPKDFLSRFGFTDYTRLEPLRANAPDARPDCADIPIIYGDVRDIEKYAPPGQFDLITWSEGTERLASLDEVHRLLSYMQSAARFLVVTYLSDTSHHGPALNGASNGSGVKVTRDWLSSSFPSAIFLDGGPADDPAHRLICGVWREPRFHLENLHGPKDAEVKIGVVANSEPELEGLLAKAQDPMLDGGWMHTSLSTLANYPLRAFLVDELSDRLAEEYPLMIFGKDEQGRYNVRPWRASVAYVHDHHKRDLDSINRAHTDAIFTPYATNLSKRYAFDCPIMLMPNIMYPELIHRAERCTGGILVTGALQNRSNRERLHRILGENHTGVRRHGITEWHWTNRISAAAAGSNFNAFTKTLGRFNAVVFAKDNYGYLVRKYFEILGSALGIGIPPPLMIAPRIGDTDAIGLIPGVHYLALALDNFWNQMEWVSNNQTECTEIAACGHRWYLDFIQKYRDEILPANVASLLASSSDERPRTGYIPPHPKRPECVVSVVIPCLNGTQHLSRTIDSVLRQDHPNVECIVVDMGVSDKAAHTLEPYNDRVTLVTAHTDSQAEAINRGLQKAYGVILAWLLPGDEWATPDVVSRVVALMNANPDLDVLYGDCGYLRTNSTAAAVVRSKEWDLEDAAVFCENRIPSSAAFIRHRALDKVGQLDITYNHLMDHDLWLRIGLAGAIQHAQMVLAHTRNPVDNHNGHGVERAREFVQLTKKFFSLPDLDPRLRRRRRQALSNAYLMGVKYAWNDGHHWPTMASHTVHAIIGNPGILPRVIRRLTRRPSVKRAA